MAALIPNERLVVLEVLKSVFPMKMQREIAPGSGPQEQADEVTLAG